MHPQAVGVHEQVTAEAADSAAGGVDVDLRVEECRGDLDAKDLRQLKIDSVALVGIYGVFCSIETFRDRQIFVADRRGRAEKLRMELGLPGGGSRESLEQLAVSDRVSPGIPNIYGT